MAAVTTLMIGVLLAGCAPAERESAPQVAIRTADEQAIRDLDARWLELAQERDAAGEAALYASDGIAYRANVNLLVGPGAIEAYARKDYAENPSSRVTWTTDSLHVAEARDLAVQTGEVHVTGLGPKGDGEDRLRFLTVWKKVDGEWKVAHDMGSSVMPRPSTP